MVADSCFWCDDVDGLGRGPLTRPWSPDLDGRWSSHGSWSSTIRLEIFQLKIEQERLRLVSRSNRRAEYPNTVGIWIPTIWIPNFLKFGFQMVGSCAMLFVLHQPLNTGPVHKKTRWRPFVRHSNYFWPLEFLTCSVFEPLLQIVQSSLRPEIQTIVNLTCLVFRYPLYLC